MAIKMAILLHDILVSRLFRASYYMQFVSICFLEVKAQLDSILNLRRVSYKDIKSSIATLIKYYCAI